MVVVQQPNVRLRGQEKMSSRTFLGVIVAGLFACSALAQPANRVTLTLDRG